MSAKQIDSSQPRETRHSVTGKHHDQKASSSKRKIVSLRGKPPQSHMGHPERCFSPEHPRNGVLFDRRSLSSVEHAGEKISPTFEVFIRVKRSILAVWSHWSIKNYRFCNKNV
ncbi:hypothetical protein NPIL_434821 [Nephila pilipes]|uniref:Uncharacterized protein n=1 Tax=Nephila pilipes TaxID=299642 RepID=A0A8X6JTG3_NEPPI|nr:hypothetical protein NPIL_434821 [Nephila pilipes]